MPTVTTTITKSSRATQKSFLPLSSVASESMAETSKAAALQSLYNRATRAFVLRDIALTYSLLQSGFALLNPPTVVPDSLSDHRRKWDILRITFESTVYTSPPLSTESLPETLRANLMESPQTLATSIYSRSLALFTPSSEDLSKTALNAAYLPYQVISTVVYCTLKIDAPDVGRVVIEDWLALRDSFYSLEPSEKQEGGFYYKILELYTLHILPKLEQWDYAKEFLEYESELTSQRREVGFVSDLLIGIFFSTFYLVPQDISQFSAYSSNGCSPTIQGSTGSTVTDFKFTAFLFAIPILFILIILSIQHIYTYNRPINPS